MFQFPMKKFFLLLCSFSMLQTVAQDLSQDWPNLKKYRASNESLLQSEDFPEVVFMGNSITEGWHNQRPEFFEKHNFVGRGIGGQTTPQMLIRFTPDVLDLKPKAVVILAGTNDIAGNTGYSSAKMITDNISAMAELARANDIKVVLSSILPVYTYPWSPDTEAVARIAEVNTWLKEYANANDFVYLDYFSHMADDKKGLKKEYSGDGVHPNVLGYQVMEPLVLEAIRQALEN